MSKKLIFFVLIQIFIFSKVFCYSDDSILNISDDDFRKLDAPVSPLHEVYGFLGDSFYKYIPEGEDKEKFINLIKEYSEVHKSICGCEYKNPAVFNEMTALEFETKVLEPAKKLANGKQLPENQKNLIFVVCQNSTLEGAFNENLKFPLFKRHKYQYYTGLYFFEEPFFDHYDNIFVIQPNNNLFYDDMMDVFMPLYEKFQGTKNVTDFIYMGHGIGDDADGAVISAKKSSEKACINRADFKPLENGGNIYAQSLKNVFEKNIEDGFTPKMIGLGCTSELLQYCVFNLMEDKKDLVQVFGTPCTASGALILGYNCDELSLFTSVSYHSAYSKKTLFMEVKISNEEIPENTPIVETFYLDGSSLGKDIFTNKKNGITSGIVAKKSGVLMEYQKVIFEGE